VKCVGNINAMLYSKILKSTVWAVLKLYFNINLLANGQNNYNLLILISSQRRVYKRSVVHQSI